MNKHSSGQATAGDDIAAGRTGPVWFRPLKPQRLRPAVTEEDLTRARSYVDARTPGNLILRRARARATRRRLRNLIVWTIMATTVLILASGALPETMAWWRDATPGQQAGFLTLNLVGLFVLSFLTLLGRLVVDAASVDGRPAEKDIVIEALIATGARPTTRERVEAARAEARTVLVQGLRGTRGRRGAASRNGGGRS